MKIHELHPHKISQETLDQLQRGAFLIVKAKGKTNVMTIGWGQIGIMWSKPVFVAPVRLSRFTYELLKEADEFSVCVPKPSDMTKEIAYCGSKSGRDVDKIKELALPMAKARSIDTPIISRCRYHFECSILSRVVLSKDDFSPDHKTKFYNHDDFHVLFYGEIKESYMLD